MSSSNISSGNSNKTVIEKAILHAQKLRNKMAEAISNNDPFGSVCDVKHNNSLASEDDYSYTHLTTSKRKYNTLSSHEQDLIHAFLKGDIMSKHDEFCAMELLKSLSANDLCRATESVYCSYHNKCICTLCKAFNDENLRCDIKRSGDRHVIHNPCYTAKSNSFVDDVKDKYRSYQYELLKYVDCVKVCIHSVYLTDVALQMLSGHSKDRKGHVPASANTYFLQYRIPEILQRKSVKLKSKVNTGLTDPDLMRMCSRKLDDGAIYFKHIGIHDICSLETFNLEDIEVTFEISCRTPKQKNINVLGYTSFNFGLLEASKNLTCNRELIVKLKENSPVIVGTIKVSFQLGCGRLFFGKHFIDTLDSNKENSVPLCSDEVSISDSEKILKKERECNSSNKKTKTVIHVPSKKEQTCQTECLVTTIHQANKEVSCKSAEVQTENIYTLIQDNEKEVLIGFLYISQAQFLTKPLNSYITCRLFGQHEASESRLIENTSNPIFNFCQVIPLVYEDYLIKTLQNNFMVIEIFEKLNSRDIVIGVTKLPLQQFYLAYKNPVVVKYLKKNKLPIIGTDWWEPITLPLTDEVVGQIQVLTALGTEEQIENLELKRGFKALNVKPNPQNYIYSSVSYSRRFEANQMKTAKESGTVAMSGHDSNPYLTSEGMGNKTELQKSTLKEPQSQKLDVAVQSESTMYTKPPEAKSSATQDVLDMFLNKLISQRQKNICVENSTNTDDDKVDAMRTANSDEPSFTTTSQKDAQNATNVELRKTSDLLDSLQKALAIDSIPQLAQEINRDVFKVHIKIENALHLPSRKKCKSKKSKNRGAKWEDILPSTYVTFETRNSHLHITKVCQKSTSPCWNYEETLNLPSEFLINNQKRLIFKVWRKSTNTTIQPHMQTDVVLGFAALDLTVLMTGLPNIQGWFNIVDFSGKINGQINITVTPLENVSKHQLLDDTCNSLLEHHSVEMCNQTVPNSKGDTQTVPNSKGDTITEEPGELLSRALKRKFSELDEITQRLRLRLSKVTNDESDLSNDELTEEFERDINTLCIEDDFDMVNFEDKAPNVKSYSHSDLLCSRNVLEINTSDPNNCSSESSALSLVSMETTASTSNGNTAQPLTLKIDTQSNNEVLNKDLLLGRQHIEALLDKLSALQTSDGNLILNKTSNVGEKTTASSADVSTFSSRFVSGCSANTEEQDSCIDTEAILKELDHTSRPNIHSCSTYDPTLFQQIYNDDLNNYVDSCASKSSSGSSIFTSCSRVAPDGAGTSTDEKVKTPADI